MNNDKQTLTWGITTMALTLIHHAYGALIYAEPFRLHVAIFAIPVIALMLISYFVLKKSRHGSRVKTTLVWSFRILTIVFPVAAIGLYEGGYNHVVKNILYFSGTSVEFLNSIYPSVYELPNNFIFEFTGVAQFVAGVLCAHHLLFNSKKTTRLTNRTPA